MSIPLIRRGMMAQLSSSSSPESKHIEFQDNNVFQILMAHNVSSDGIGITLADIEKVASLSTWFKDNVLISLFNEFDKFSSVTSLSETFSGCSNLKQIGNNEKLTKIGYRSFYNCTSLTGDFYFPNLVGDLGKQAFFKTQITSFNAPLLENIDTNDEEYGVGAFYNCPLLKEVNIPKVKNLGTQIFYDCPLLEKVVLDEVRKIGKECFSNCTSLGGDMILPNLTGTLGNRAFFKTQITKFIAPLLQYIEAIDWGKGAFQYCTKLQEVEIPKVTRIQKQTFYGCAELKKVVMKAITSIEEEVFAKCSALTTMVIDKTSPPSLSTTALSETPSSMKIYVPDDAVSTYKSASGWSSYASRIYPLSEYTE